MPTTPIGFAAVTTPLRHVNLAREAVITYGLDVSSLANIVPATADSVQNQMTGNILSSIDNEVTVGPTELSVGTVSGNLVIEGTVAQIGGAVAVTSMPSQVALLIRKQTARGGRRGRGRMFFPWILRDADVNDTGIVTAGAVAAFQGAVTQWLDDLANVLFAPMVLLHSPSDPDTQTPTPEGDPDDITALVVDPMVGTQRRRLGRSG